MRATRIPHGPEWRGCPRAGVPGLPRRRASSTPSASVRSKYVPIAWVVMALLWVPSLGVTACSSEVPTPDDGGGATSAGGSGGAAGGGTIGTGVGGCSVSIGDCTCTCGTSSEKLTAMCDFACHDLEGQACGAAGGAGGWDPDCGCAVHWRIYCRCHCGDHDVDVDGLDMFCSDGVWTEQEVCGPATVGGTGAPDEMIPQRGKLRCRWPAATRCTSSTPPGRRGGPSSQPPPRDGSGSAPSRPPRSPQSAGQARCSARR